MFFSAFQVHYPSPGQIVVIDPPTLWIAVFWYGLALIGLIIVLNKPGIRNLANMAGGILLLIGAVGGWTNSCDSSVTIDKQAGTFTFHSPWPRSDYVRSLGELKYATVETTTAAYRI